MVETNLPIILLKNNILFPYSEIRIEVVHTQDKLVVENALKHNIATKSEPLTIEIIADAERVTVKNNLNRKEAVFSTRKGLRNIIDRYKMLSEQAVRVQQTETEFIVSLPLI